MSCQRHTRHSYTHTHNSGVNRQTDSQPFACRHAFVLLNANFRWSFSAALYDVCKILSNTEVETTVVCPLFYAKRSGAVAIKASKTPVKSTPHKFITNRKWAKSYMCVCAHGWDGHKYVSVVVEIWASGAHTQAALFNFPIEFSQMVKAHRPGLCLGASSANALSFTIYYRFFFFVALETLTFRLHPHIFGWDRFGWHWINIFCALLSFSVASGAICL